MMRETKNAFLIRFLMEALHSTAQHNLLYYSVIKHRRYKSENYSSRNSQERSQKLVWKHTEQKNHPTISP